MHPPQEVLFCALHILHYFVQPLFSKILGHVSWISIMSAYFRDHIWSSTQTRKKKEVNLFYLS